MISEVLKAKTQARDILVLKTSWRSYTFGVQILLKLSSGTDLEGPSAPWRANKSRWSPGGLSGDDLAAGAGGGEARVLPSG